LNGIQEVSGSIPLISTIGIWQPLESCGFSGFFIQFSNKTFQKSHSLLGFHVAFQDKYRGKIWTITEVNM
jgi:hypothetical protein